MSANDLDPAPLPHHPPGTGACPLPGEGPCCDACAREYDEPDLVDDDSDEEETRS